MLRTSWPLLGFVGFLLIAVTLGLSSLSKPVAAESDILSASSSGEASGYHIIYLLTDGAVAADSKIAPLQMQKAAGAQVAHTWTEVLTLAQAAPIDALIVHDSALSLVDSDWLTKAYRRGVVIGAFNIYAPELAELLNDGRIAADGFASESHPGDFYIFVSALIQGQPDDVNLLESAGSPAEPVVGIRHHASVYFGRSTDDIKNAGDYLKTLKRHLEQVRQVRNDFESGALQRPIVDTP